MTRTEILQKLNLVFCDVFDDETLKISEETTAKEVEGWDSLMHITLVLAIEDSFETQFDMKEVIKLKTVQEFMDALEQKQ